MYRFPDPLDEDSLKPLMADERYGDPSHPENPFYRKFVDRAFALVYPDPPRDGAGNFVINPRDPPKPQVITGGAEFKPWEDGRDQVSPSSSFDWPETPPHSRLSTTTDGTRLDLGGARESDDYRSRNERRDPATPSSLTAAPMAEQRAQHMPVEPVPAYRDTWRNVPAQTPGPTDPDYRDAWRNVPARAPGPTDPAYRDAWRDFPPRTPSVPDYKAQVGTVTGNWKSFSDEMAKRGYPERDQRMFRFIFANEGGRAEDPNSKAFAGIGPGAYSDVRKQNPGLNLPGDRTTLTNGQIADVYNSYLNVGLNKAGGLRALDRINDPDSATVVADTVFSHGPSKGADLLREALNRTIDQLPEEERASLGLNDFAQHGANLKGQRLRTADMDFLTNLVNGGYANDFRKNLCDVREKEKPEWAERVRQIC